MLDAVADHAADGDLAGEILTARFPVNPERGMKASVNTSI
jgi:hypothetical protein